MKVLQLMLYKAHDMKDLDGDASIPKLSTSFNNMHSSTYVSGYSNLAGESNKERNTSNFQVNYLAVASSAPSFHLL